MVIATWTAAWQMPITGTACDFTGCVQARVVEAGDHVGVDALRLASPDLREHRWHGHCFVGASPRC